MTLMFVLIIIGSLLGGLLARIAVDRAYGRGWDDGLARGLSGTPEAARRRAMEAVAYCSRHTEDAST